MGRPSKYNYEEMVGQKLYHLTLIAIELDGRKHICCSFCNYKKGDQSKDEFLEWIKRVAVHTSIIHKEE